jgi:hypothetical protein
LPARNRGASVLHIMTQATNFRMVRILRRLGATMQRTGSEIEAEVKLAPASAVTIAEEWGEQSWALACELAWPMSARRAA